MTSANGALSRRSLSALLDLPRNNAFKIKNTALSLAEILQLFKSLVHLICAETNIQVGHAWAVVYQCTHNIDASPHIDGFHRKVRHSGAALQYLQDTFLCKTVDAIYTQPSQLLKIGAVQRERAREAMEFQSDQVNTFSRQQI